MEKALLDLVLLQQLLEARAVGDVASALLVDGEHPDVGLMTNAGRVDRVVGLRKTKGFDPIRGHH